MHQEAVTRIQVENWGPIAHGEVEIKPLTIFIGPNNTGKSYMAMLYYALARTLSSLFHRLDVSLLRELWSSVPKGSGTEESTRDTLSVLEDLLKKRVDDILVRELERVYSSEVKQLVRVGHEDARVIAHYRSRTLTLRLELRVSNSEGIRVDLSLEVSKDSTSRLWHNLLALDLFLKAKRDAIRRISPRLLLELLEDFMESLKLELYGSRFIFERIHYLPASRAGILQGYRTIASAFIALAPIAAIRGLKMPGLPGPVADFLVTLLEVTPGKEEEVKAANLLEGEVIEGSIKVLQHPQEAPIIVYEREGLSVPLARASSMIGELTPLALYLKYGSIGVGDAVIIEEPEAHLHPDKQAKLAELLASLVNNMKLTLIVTTHSDILLAKLSNLVSMSTLPLEEIQKLGYTRDRILSPDNVAVYYFKPTNDGVAIEKVEVTEEGIPDDAFRAIIEELYRETMDIHYKIQKLKTGSQH